MTVKELLRELQKEKYDITRVPLYLVTGSGRYTIHSVEQYDDCVQLMAGDRVDDEE